MENLSIGINVIFPVFFVIFVGFFLRRRNLIDDSFVSMSTKLVFYVALPAKLFFDIRNSKLTGINGKYTIYLLIGIIATYCLAWFLGRFFIKDKRKLSAFVHCVYRSNFVYIGLPIIDEILKKPDMDSVIIVMIFGLTLYNILAIIVLTYYNGDKLRPIHFVIKVVKNPMIIAIFAGIVFKYLNIPIYHGIEAGCNNLAKLCTPLSLILIGGSLKFGDTSKNEISTREAITKDMGIVLSCAIIKDAIISLAMIPVGLRLGFTSSQIVVAFIFFSSPCAVNCFIMGKQMGSDAELTSKIITMSFAISIFTYSIGISILKAINVI